MYGAVLVASRLLGRQVSECAALCGVTYTPHAAECA
jgi:hypothetical protein